MLTEKNFLPWKTIDFFGSKLAGKWKNGKTTCKDSAIA